MPTQKRTKNHYSENNVENFIPHEYSLKNFHKKVTIMAEIEKALADLFAAAGLSEEHRAMAEPLFMAVLNDPQKIPKMLAAFSAAASKMAAQDEPSSALPWPTVTYSAAHRATGCNIVQFLEEHYAPLIKAGQVTRVTLRKHDPSADMAVANYLRGGRQLPEGLQIPTKKELNDRALEAVDWKAVRDSERIARLYRLRVAASR